MNFFQRILLVATALLVTCTAVSAQDSGWKVVDETTAKIFSVELPGSWTFHAKEGAWVNSNDLAAIVLTSAAVEMSLDEWAAKAAKRNIGTTINSDTLGGITARRLEFTTPEGFRTYIWIAKRENTGAVVSLGSSSASAEDIPTIYQRLMSSFQWK